MNIERKTFEAIYDKAYELSRFVDVQTDNLESAFDRGRGRKGKHGTIDFTFSDDGIDTTQWLANNIYKLAMDLASQLSDMLNDEISAQNAAYMAQRRAQRASGATYTPTAEELAMARQATDFQTADDGYYENPGDSDEAQAA